MKNAADVIMTSESDGRFPHDQTGRTHNKTGSKTKTLIPATLANSPPSPLGLRNVESVRARLRRSDRRLSSRAHRGIFKIAAADKGVCTVRDRDYDERRQFLVILSSPASPA